MLNDLLTLSETELYYFILGKFATDNPQLKIGQRMPRLSGTAANGVLLPDTTIATPANTLVSESWKITFQADGMLPLLECTGKGWFYPYNISLPNADWLRGAKIGEKTKQVSIVTNPAFESGQLDANFARSPAEAARYLQALQKIDQFKVVETTVVITQKLIDENSFITMAGAFSSEFHIKYVPPVE